MSMMNTGDILETIEMSPVFIMLIVVCLSERWICEAKTERARPLN